MNQIHSSKRHTHSAGWRQAPLRLDPAIPASSGIQRRLTEQRPVSASSPNTLAGATSIGPRDGFPGPAQYSGVPAEGDATTEVTWLQRPAPNRPRVVAAAGRSETHKRMICARPRG